MSARLRRPPRKMKTMSSKQLHKGHLRQAQEAAPELVWEIEETAHGQALVGVRDAHSRDELVIQMTSGIKYGEPKWTAWLRARTRCAPVNFTVDAYTINAALGAARIVFRETCEQRAALEVRNA